jgi:hypothetical protein
MRRIAVGCRRDIERGLKWALDPDDGRSDDVRCLPGLALQQSVFVTAVDSPGCQRCGRRNDQA